MRFPKLKFGFLEGGVAWAVLCYCDLISHFQKRNGNAMLEFLNPARVDHKLFAELVARYARRKTEGDLASLQNSGTASSEILSKDHPFPIDEFEKSGIRKPEDIRDIFAERFYFGCEGDDPLNAMAFQPRGIPFDAKLKALYGSDIGHWDVPDMAEVAEEAYELVEHGLIDKESLRTFLFDNAIRFWTANNPVFFKGTVVEGEVERRRSEIDG